MKWLKIKKCLKIFSVVICSIFILSNKANALTNIKINSEEYKKIGYERLEKYNLVDKFKDLFEYIENNSNLNYYIYLELNNSSFNFRIDFIKDISKINDFTFIKYSDINLELNLRNNNLEDIYIDSLLYYFKYYDSIDNSFFDNVKNDIINLISNPEFYISKNMNTYFKYENNEIKYDTIRYYYTSFDLDLNNYNTKENVNLIFEDGFIFKEGVSSNEFFNKISIFNYKIEDEFKIPGYKKVVIPADKQYAIISGVKTGRVYYKANSQISSYYDKSNREWGSIDWPKAITDLRKATFADNPNNPDLNSLYYFYDFDLSQVQDSQFILIEKYHEKVCNLPNETIEECNNRYNYEQEIWIPDNADIYFSFIDVTPNENGGNDFDFDYKDPETGDINNSHTENDSSPDNEVGTFFDYLYKLLNNFQSGFIYISECFTNFFNELPFMIQAILGLAFTIGIVKFIIDLFK